MFKDDAEHGGVPTINIVVPLAGRLDAFRSFLYRFEKNILSVETNIHLTIVVFGVDHWEDVRREVVTFEKRTKFYQYHLLNAVGNFSRARGLQVHYIHMH